MSRRAVIVSTARTGLAKSFRGGFNSTHGALLGGHAIKHAIAKAGIEPEAIEDVFMGCGMPEGETGMNIARNAALAGGCPVTTSGITVNRFCSSGLQAVAMAAQTILVDGVPVAIGGGLDSISLVQPKMIKGAVVEKSLMKSHPALWMPMSRARGSHPRRRAAPMGRSTGDHVAALLLMHIDRHRTWQDRHGRHRRCAVRHLA
jgi:acetyl-CoA C-acetyltransferase